MSGTPGLALALLRASDWFNDALLARLAARGWPRLTRTQSATFAALGGEGVRPATLARRVGVTRQSMHTLLAQLQANGLIAVQPDPEDRRASVVVLTARGRDLVADAAAILAELEVELSGRIGAGPVRALRDALAAEWGPPPLS